MILYHFTTHAVVPAIRQQGILATPNLELVRGLSVAALTVLPTTAITEADRALITGYKDRPTWLAATDARLTVRIPSTDRRLIKLETWLRTQAPSYGLIDPNALMPSARAWWIYEGDIPATAVVEWDSTEGTGVTLWPRNDPSRIKAFADAGMIDHAPPETGRHYDVRRK